MKKGWRGSLGPRNPPKTIRKRNRLPSTPGLVKFLPSTPVSVISRSCSYALIVEPGNRWTTPAHTVVPVSVAYLTLPPALPWSSIAAAGTWSRDRTDYITNFWVVEGKLHVAACDWGKELLGGTGYILLRVVCVVLSTNCMLLIDEYYPGIALSSTLHIILLPPSSTPGQLLTRPMS